jgi:hypothetical protein
VRGAETAGPRPGAATSTTSSGSLHGLTQADFITECNFKTPEREKTRTPTAGVRAAWARAPPTLRTRSGAGLDANSEPRCPSGDRRPCVRYRRHVERDRLPSSAGCRLGSP